MEWWWMSVSFLLLMLKNVILNIFIDCSVQHDDDHKSSNPSQIDYCGFKFSTSSDCDSSDCKSEKDSSGDSVISESTQCSQISAISYLGHDINDSSQCVAFYKESDVFSYLS